MAGCDGRLEAIIDGLASGWAHDSTRPRRRVEVEIHVDGELVAETVADQMRPTLAQAGIGDGRHGFLVELPTRLCDGALHTISVQSLSGDQLPTVGSFQALATGAAPEWAGTRFTAGEIDTARASSSPRGPDSAGSAPRLRGDDRDRTAVPAQVRSRPSRQLQYPRRSLKDGFTVGDTAETILLGEHLTVARPDPLNPLIQPAVRDPEHERASRMSLQREYLADRPAATRLPGALLDTSSFVIYPTEHQYLSDSVRHHRNLRSRGYGLLEDGGIEREAQPITEREERVVVLGAQTNANYSHWLLESLVRALLFRPLDDGSRMYLTPPLNSWQRETLELIGVDRERILECKPTGFTRFAEIVAVSRAMMNVYTYIPGAIDALAALSPTTPRGRRIYSSRALANRRHITNDAEIVKLLSGHGFEVVHPESLTIAEQIELFAGAETVLGVHGSGLTNTIFSSSGTTVIELQPEGLAYGENAVVRTLAAVRHQPFVQVVCALTPGMEDLPLQHRDLTVDPRGLDQLLRSVLPG